jgi:hypothetical protein
MRKLKQLLLAALVLALAACGGRQATEVASRPFEPQAMPPAATVVAPTSEEPLDVRDDEVVWGTSEESGEPVSEAEGDELDEPTAVLNAEEAEVVSESDDIRPAIISESLVTEERSRPRKAAKDSEAAPAPTSGTEDISGNETGTAGLASPASSSVTENDAADEERNTPAVAENGSYYGEISPATGRPKTVNVRGYYRKDGTYVRGHYRSAPRRKN